jgi:hypothetical protein
MQHKLATRKRPSNVVRDRVEDEVSDVDSGTLGRNRHSPPPWVVAPIADCIQGTP